MTRVPLDAEPIDGFDQIPDDDVTQWMEQWWRDEAPKYTNEPDDRAFIEDVERLGEQGYIHYVLQEQMLGDWIAEGG